ncbi:MAG: hypothetical protein COB22_06390 [Cycloclasticus sp.]|nr:MAG: hypothetical protein COB22_06390 [Cycloclasticus sp.]
MSPRKSLGKKLRFEVFKRDSFTCQYCGKVAPNVVLEVDHIEPVAKGGGDELLNLITSCFDCNRGKKDNKLDDDSVVKKQRLQLEELQERREQIKLMFDWRNELNNINENTNQMVIDYIEDKIDNFTLNEKGAKKIAPLTKKYDLADILESIDLSAQKYLTYDNDGELIQDGVEDFLNKISGILINKNKPPVEQKVSYIKGICRNRFSYWNPQSGSIVLNAYINSLKNHGWDENRILEDLENEVIPKTKEVKNWSEWKGLLEKWTVDVNNWDIETETIETDDEELDEVVSSLVNDRENILPAIIYIGKTFDDFSEDGLLEKIDMVVLNYLTELEEYYDSPSEERTNKPTYYHLGYSSGLLSMFKPINSMLTFHLDNAVHSIFRQFIEHIDIYNDENAKSEYFRYIANKYHQAVVLNNEKA